MRGYRLLFCCCLLHWEGLGRLSTGASLSKVCAQWHKLCGTWWCTQQCCQATGIKNAHRGRFEVDRASPLDNGKQNISNWHHLVHRREQQHTGLLAWQHCKLEVIIIERLLHQHMLLQVQ